MKVGVGVGEEVIASFGGEVTTKIKTGVSASVGNLPTGVLKGVSVYLRGKEVKRSRNHPRCARKRRQSADCRKRRC